MDVNRRAVLQSMVAALAGVPIAGAAFTSSALPTFTYGYLTPDICNDRGLNSASAQVFLDGIDVTALRIAALDDRAGYIEIYKRDALGKCHLDETGWAIARERRYGHVEVRFS